MLDLDRSARLPLLSRHGLVMLPDAKRASAAKAAEAMAGSPTATLTVGDASHELPGVVTELLREILEQLGAGHAVGISKAGDELTTQEAANLLNVSRPHVVKLIDAGDLPCRMVGTHRRVELSDVLELHEKMFTAQLEAIRRSAKRRRTALDETTRLSENTDGGYE